MASAGKVLMCVENVYPGDPRVRREAQALRDAGYQIVVVALRSDEEPKQEIVDGIQVYRMPLLTVFEKIPLRDSNVLSSILIKTLAIVGYVSEYAYFSLGCFLMSLRIWAKHGFDVIHVHNPPDTLWPLAWFYKLFGKKFIFDHHDLSAEMYKSRYGASDGLVTRMLLWHEKRNLKVADVLIATNESYKAIQVRRGKVSPGKIFVVRNGPDLRRTRKVEPDSALRAKGKYILGYLGALNPQDGVDYLLRALHHMVYNMKRTDFYCVIIGTGDSLDDLRSLTKELKLDDYVSLPGYLPEDHMLATLNAADICMDPDPSSPLNDVSTWIKIMEYMALEKPIVSFELKETRYSAQEAAVWVEPNNIEAFAEATARLMDDPERRRRMGSFGRQRVEKELQWSIVSRKLIEAYASLNLRNHN